MSVSESELIQQLRQANQRWRRLALSAIAVLVLVVLGASGFSVVQYQRAEAARLEAEAQRERAEELLRKAQQQAQEALTQAQRLQYAASLHAAQQAWLEGGKQSREEKERP